MRTKKRFTQLVIVLILGFFVFNIVFPSYINKGLSFIKPKVASVPLLRAVPLFPEKPFKLGLDLLGGSHLIYETDLTGIEIDGKKEAMAGLRDVIERRVNMFGVSEPIVAVQETEASYRLVVDLPGVKNVKEAIDQIGKTPYLEFKKERPEAETEEILQKQEEYKNKTDADLKTVEEKIEKMKVELQDPYFEPTSLTGRFVKQATVSLDQRTMEVLVLLEFNDEGSALFETITEENIGKRLAIYIDNALISAPVVREAIPSGKAQISGNFTIEGAKSLVRNLNAGALPVPITLISQTTVGPTLGKVSLDQSLRAAFFGILAVILFMLVFYRLNGFFASLALLLYAGILLSLFKLIPVTLTLAGIGGAILSVGMAIDANVLIFERIKEERAKGESFQKALDQGFSRAWPSIRDSNLTTLIVALIMFTMGSSFVKGFAFTLGLGILTSMFSAMFATRAFLQVFVSTRLEKMRWLWE